QNGFSINYDYSKKTQKVKLYATYSKLCATTDTKGCFYVDNSFLDFLYKIDKITLPFVHFIKKR
ncbi:MAG: hypothetical protein U0K93_04845, partial [Acutalibacteraceae bacterium]|nr:hypothetical protein [Acutalibacteraceae bacterium]